MELTIDELRMQLEESQQKLKIMMQHNDELKLQLIVEKSKNELQINFDSSDDSDHTGNQQIPRSLPGETCCETFGTNSGLLMQFKYDELRESYGKSVKNVCKKDKYLRQLLNETEKLRFHNYQITEENKELNLKIANICYKYLELLDQRSEEQLQMKICVESLSSRLKK